MKSSKKWRSAAAIVGIAVGLVAPVLSFADDGNKTINRGVLKELSDDWWQWSLSIPAVVNPLSFNTEEESARYCGVGQHGNVWFLGGTLDGSEAERRCTIPAGMYIFFPIINAECSSLEGNGTTEEELRACVKGLIDNVTFVEAHVDGVALKGEQRSRVQSTLFSFTLPPGDVLKLFGGQPNPTPAVSDGFWVLLRPLSAGAHTIEWRGVATFPDGSTFEQKTKYRLMILPKQK
jgi:hypothetical protein